LLAKYGIKPENKNFVVLSEKVRQFETLVNSQGWNVQALIDDLADQKDCQKIDNGEVPNDLQLLLVLGGDDFKGAMFAPHLYWKLKKAGLKYLMISGGIGNSTQNCLAKAKKTSPFSGKEKEKT